MCQRSHRDEFVQITSGSRARGAGDRDVVGRAESAREAIDPFPEHAGDDPGLPLIHLVAESVVEFNLREEEVDQREAVFLRVQYRPCKVG